MDSTVAFDRLRAVAMTSLLGLALAVVALPAEARDGASKRARPAAGAQQHPPRPRGDYTRQTQVDRTATGHTRTDTWSSERGTSTREAQVVRDREQQMRTRDVEWSGPKGQQARRTDVTQRTESGYTRNSTATGPNGGTSTRDVEATRDASSGTWTKDVSVQRTPPAGDGG
jgi:hypothetical protein